MHHRPSPFTPLRLTIACISALVLLFALGGAPAGAYSVQKLAPASVTRSSVVFRLPKLRPQSIHLARLVVRRKHRTRTYRVRVTWVRKALGRGALSLRPPHRASTPSASSVLVLTVSNPAPAGRASQVAAPAPPPPAPAGPCASAYGTFAGGSQPPGCWRPYSAASPFNREIPPSPRVLGNSSAVVGRLLGFGHIQNLLGGTAGRGELDGGRPIYYSQPNDPTFTLHCTESWGTCAVEGATVQIPDGAQPAGGSDAHLSVVDQRSNVEYDLWGVQSKPAGGGTLTARWGGKTRIDGNGLGSDAVAAQYGTAAGILRAEELQAGQINHALFIGVQCDSGTFVYPATKGGSRCSDPTNAPPEGTRFQLAMSDAEISAMAAPDWKKTILRAMAHYGMIVGDTGGSWGIAQESGMVYTSFGQQDKWAALAQQWNVPFYSGDHDYVFNLADGVDWGRYLRVVDPCVSQGTC